MTARRIYISVVGEADQTLIGRNEASNGIVHVVALACTKIADGLTDPKIVLAWLLTAIGAPAAFIGALVPVREAGALLPQLALARRVEASRVRKSFWIVGSAAQGAAAFGIALSVIFLDSWVAGLGVIVCLVLLATARAACSVSYKDALARTIAKTRRGAVTGAAASAASAAVLGFGAALAAGLIPREPSVIGGVVALAGLLWLTGAAVFSLLSEPQGDADDMSGNGLDELVQPLVDDLQLRRFILARALLTVTALAPPFLVILSSAGEAQRLGHLGPLVLASAGASIFSAYVWGRLSDQSSRQTLMASGALGAVALAAAAGMGIATGGLGGVAGSVLAVFAIQIAYEGVRAGRKLHLTDMAAESERARYTALSNSLIGGVLLIGGALGFLADLLGPSWALAVFAVLCGLAVPVAASLDEVQEPDLQS